MGFHVSFAGIVTFPKAVEIQRAARMVPADRLLIETDAPYLAPVPYRGKRNEPAFVVDTARRLPDCAASRGRIAGRDHSQLPASSVCRWSAALSTLGKPDGVR